MRATKLKSSALKRIAYDEEASTLSIWFKDSGLYVYYVVPASVYEGLKRASSAGRFFCESIKGKYPCKYDPGRRRFRPPS